MLLCCSYADDTSLLLSNADIEQLYIIANIEVNQLCKWFCANKLSFNVNKTKHIIL